MGPSVEGGVRVEGDSNDGDDPSSAVEGNGAAAGHDRPMRAASEGQGGQGMVTSREDENEEFGFLQRGLSGSGSEGGGLSDGDGGPMGQRRVVASRGMIRSGDDDGGSSDTGDGAVAVAGAVAGAAHAAPVDPPSDVEVEDDPPPLRFASPSFSSSPIGVGRGGTVGGEGSAGTSGSIGGSPGSQTARGSRRRTRAGAAPQRPAAGDGNGRPRAVRRSQAYYDRLMMPQTETASAVAGPSSSSGRRHPPSEPESYHSTADSGHVDVPPDSLDSNLVALCRAGRWDQVRELLLMLRIEWDNTSGTTTTTTSSRRRREVSACPRVCGVSPLKHFAYHGTFAYGPCHCDTALSIACGFGRSPEMSALPDDPTASPSQSQAPLDVIEALWRFCPEQLAHVTIDVAGAEDASTPTVRVYPRASGAPLHHALWAVRWSEGEGGGTYCSGLDLVECLVDAVSSGGTVTERRGKTPADEEGEDRPPTVPTLPLVASRLADHGGRTPLQIWVEHIFPRLMTLGGRRPEVAAAAAASDAVDDATTAQSPPDDGAGNAEEGETIFRRWMDVLRKILVAWPCACSVPDASGTTLLITVLRWESPAPQQHGGGAGGDEDGIRRTTMMTTPSRAVVERRLLEVVRIMLGEESSSPSGSGGATYWSCSSFGCSPLHYAVEYKRSSAVIGAILDASSTSSSSLSSTTQRPLPIRRNNVMEVPLHVAAALRAPLSVMGLLLRRRAGGCAPADQATAMDRGGRSPLTWAYIRFLEHYHGLIVSRRRTDVHGAGRRDVGRDDAIAAATAPAEVPRARRKIIPRRLKAMEEEVLGSLQRHAAKNQEDLLSELGPFWDVAQLLLISAYHGRGGAATAAAASATPMLADARSFVGIEASARLTEQVRGVLTPAESRGGRWRVVHAAASLCPGCCPRGVLAIATMVHPEQLRRRDGGGRLPLHLGIRAWCGRGNDPPSSSSSSPEDDASRTSWTHDDTGPSAVQTILAHFPDAAGTTDGPSERFPLHIAIEGLLPRLHEKEEELRMMGWTTSSRAPPPGSILRNRIQPPKYTSAAAAALLEARLRHDVRRIAMAYPEALGEGDTPTRYGTGTGGLLPFMVAAAGSCGSTCLSYELLREGPDVISRFIPPSSGKEEGEPDGGLRSSATSADIRGPVPGSSSPPSSPRRSVEARGNERCGVTAHKRARCS